MYSTGAGLFIFDVVQLQALVLHDTVVGPVLGQSHCTGRAKLKNYMSQMRQECILPRVFF